MYTNVVHVHKNVLAIETGKDMCLQQSSNQAKLIIKTKKCEVFVSVFDI